MHLELVEPKARSLLAGGKLGLYRAAVMLRCLYLPPLECVSTEYIENVLYGKQKAYLLTDVKPAYLPERCRELSLEVLLGKFGGPLLDTYMPRVDQRTGRIPVEHWMDIMRTTFQQRFDDYAGEVLKAHYAGKAASLMKVALAVVEGVQHGPGEEEKTEHSLSAGRFGLAQEPPWHVDGPQGPYSGMAAAHLEGRLQARLEPVKPAEEALVEPIDGVVPQCLNRPAPPQSLKPTSPPKQKPA